MDLWSRFGNPNLNRWWVMVWTSSKWGQFWVWSQIWPWRSRSIAPQTVGILIKVFYTLGSNLVILGWTSDKLSRGQVHDWRPHGQTQATTIPDSQNWPQVKNADSIAEWLSISWNIWIIYSLRNSTRHFGGHSVHQCAYLWWSSIDFGGPKKYVIP